MDEFWVGFIFGMFICAILGLTVLFTVSTDEYKQGQIDALNGEIYYQLEKQDNGTTIWVYCEEVCKGN